MRRNARSITTSPEIVKHIDGLTQANFNLLTQLIPWLAEHERVERRFRVAVTHKLAWIEAALSVLIVDEEAHNQHNRLFCHENKLREDVKAADESISKQSAVDGLRMLQYIYSPEPAAEVRHDRRRRWWGWEI